MPNEENTEQSVFLEVEEPIVLDSTAQDIVTALQDLKDVVQPTNVYVDLDVSLLASGWSSSAPYLYNWTSDRITSECAVKVSFLSGASTADQLYIEYEKVAGGVQFEAPTKPTQDIPVRIRIINAEASSVTAITDEMVSTNTTQGASNVKQALTTVNSNISTLNEQIGNIGDASLKSKNVTSLDGYYKLTNGYHRVIGAYAVGYVVQVFYSSADGGSTWVIFLDNSTFNVVTNVSTELKYIDLDS